MSDRLGLCTNYDGCRTAEAGDAVAVADGGDFVCPECGLELMEKTGAPPLPARWKKVLAAVGVVVGLGALIGSAVMFWPGDGRDPPTDTARLRELLAQGEFEAFRRMVENARDRPDVRELIAETTIAITPTVRFQYQMKGREASPALPFQGGKSNRPRLSKDDQYRIFLDVGETARPLHLYVFQRDHYGKIDRLFPDGTYSGIGNPVTSLMTVRMPPGERDWFYVDELPNTEGGAVTETIFVTLSPWPADDLNELYGRIHEATSKEAQELLTREFIARMESRREAGLPSVFFDDPAFDHVRASPSGRTTRTR